MPTFKCLTHGITLEVNRKTEEHGENRKVIFNLRQGGRSPIHPCVMLLAREIAPGKMKLFDHLPGHVFGECDVVEVG